MSKAFWIFVKDFKEIIRNRRAIMSMIVVPAVVIPLILFAAGYFAGKAMVSEGELKAAVEPSEELAPFAEALKAEGFVVFPSDNPQAAVQEGLASVSLAWEKGPVLYYGEDFLALAKAQGAVDSVARALLVERLRRLGLPSWLLEAGKVRLVPVSGSGGGFSLGIILGYLIVIFIFAGSMYPAADITAGERERRTLEVLLSAPVKRWQITAGKTLAVFAAALITAGANITSYTLSLKFFLGSVPGASEVLGGLSVSPQTLALLGLTALPFALFAASLTVAVASFAKSYMEAQTYLGPLMVIVLIPAMASIVPGSGLWASVVPVYNTAVAIRDIVMGTHTLAQVSITFAVNCFWAALGVLAAALAFGREGLVAN